MNLSIFSEVRSPAHLHHLSIHGGIGYRSGVFKVGSDHSQLIVEIRYIIVSKMPVKIRGARDIRVRGLKQRDHKKEQEKKEKKRKTTSNDLIYSSTV